jgi:hypothetical protein
MSEKTPGQFVAIGFLVAGMAIGWFASSTRFSQQSSHSSRHSPNAVTKIQTSGPSAKGTGTVPAALNLKMGSNAQGSDAAHIEGTNADSDSAATGPGLPGRGRDD